MQYKVKHKNEETMMKKIIKNIFFILSGIVIGAYWMAKKCEEELICKEKRAQRNARSTKSACRWIRAIQDNKRIKDYFDNRNMNAVAVYGMGELGKCLVQEIEKSGIEIKCVIDRNKCINAYEYQIFSPDDDLPRVDAVIVTPVYDYKAISENLRKHTDAQIISLDDIW